MSDHQFEKIWSEQSNTLTENVTISLNELQEKTLRYSSENLSASKKLIVFDTIYKLVVFIGYVILLLIGTASIEQALFTATISVVFLLLLIRNRTLHSQLLEVNESGPVLSVLNNRYKAVLVFYPEFYFNSSVTNPLFVFAGFQFYHFFKYRENGFFQLISDPVTYIFLILAFTIPYLVQKYSYKTMVKDMETIIDLDVDEQQQHLELIRQKVQKKRRKIVFTILMALGTTLMFILLMRLI